MSRCRSGRWSGERPQSVASRPRTSLSAVYDADPEAVRLAADLRAEAADLSDTWVAAGSRLDDPQLARERETLIASYTALRDVRGRDATD